MRSVSLFVSTNRIKCCKNSANGEISLTVFTKHCILMLGLLYNYSNLINADAALERKR